jgi:hypothetical protein
MRALSGDNHIPFYLARGEYYDAVDFDDTVYRANKGLSSGSATPDSYDLVLVDEYQDFKLPFCMRCPKVVVDAVNDVLTKAEELDRLIGRIEKSYKHFPPAKGADSARSPKIAHAVTSVQREGANYMGRYLAQALAQIPADEIEAAALGGYPAALVIVAQPYRDQIVSHLEGAGYVVDIRRDADRTLSRELGISILKADRIANLGWRIVLRADALFSTKTLLSQPLMLRGVSLT